jgi:hypothetical protein
MSERFQWGAIIPAQPKDGSRGSPGAIELPAFEVGAAAATVEE